MSLDLSALRAMRKSSSSTLAKLASEVEKNSGFQKTEDNRFWKVSLDKAGSGSAVIRFLPSTSDDQTPWVKVYDHGFQGPSGKWYIEKSLTTIGQEDPVQQHVSALWEVDKELARKRKRRLQYYANILVVKDPANPENEGKVFIFRFGKKIFDKIADKLNPSFADETRVDVFNPWEGANFRLRIAKVEGYSNSDKSVFDSPSVISDDDEELLKILNSRHDLKEFVDPKNFKTYEELEKKLRAVLNESSAGMAKAADFILEDEEPRATAPAVPTRVAEPATPRAAAKVADDGDDDLSFFQNLIND